jgi:large subunit ribosomal protein L25
MLSVPAKDFEKALQQSTASQPLFNLTVEGSSTPPHAVMIKELQTSPLSRQSLHIDFYKIDMDRKIRVSVPIVTTGKSKGVEMGGMLQIIRRELEVLSLPMEIPDVIEVDVTDLDIGDSVHVQDISRKSDIEFPADVNFTVLTILSPTKEEEPEEELEEELEEGEEAGETAEPEEQD